MVRISNQIYKARAIFLHHNYLVLVKRFCSFKDAMNTIDEHIQKDQSEIQSAKASGNDPKVRHLTDELHSLEEYKEHHPEDKHDPNALELFCDANPDEPECLVYDD
tara:strand:+ start:1829 stop:2146 length:318 start_codon:yes stop_codon:yes gene_type:complete